MVVAVQHEVDRVTPQQRDQLVATAKALAATVEADKAAADRAELNLGYTKIRSPINGVVIDRRMQRGQTVTAEYQTPILFQIAQDLSQMKVQVSIGESDIDDVKVQEKSLMPEGLEVGGGHHESAISHRHHPIGQHVGRRERGAERQVVTGRSVVHDEHRPCRPDSPVTSGRSTSPRIPRRATGSASGGSGSCPTSRW